MPTLLDEIIHDLRFMRSHTLQPGWYKVLKVFLLLGFLLAYWILFGFKAAVIFLLAFAFLSSIVHLVYRIMTKTWTRTWLDFVVVQQDGKATPRSIGAFYYGAVILNAAISVLLSRLVK